MATNNRKEFVYDEETRCHTLGGVNIPSVTEVMSPLNKFEMIPPYVLERKRDLGVQFHKAVELYMRGDLDRDSVDPELIAPLETFEDFAFRAFRDDRIELMEIPLCHDRMKFCGKPDIVTESTIYDIKLRKFDKAKDYIQLAAYEKLCCFHLGRNVKDGYKLKVLSFDLEGSLRVIDAGHRQAWSVFGVLLDHHKTNLNMKNVLEGWKATI